MKRFNFGSFLVDESNEHAFQLCHDVADLKPVSPVPVVLLGDEGCGKTHLLYSIVNRVRAGSSKTGLAYVTAYDFPDQVRALIDDPSPVERAQSAILLVDQFERFRDLVEELEAVIRIFLDNNHYVVIATSVHPGRLHHLNESFKALLDSGQLAQIVPKGTETQIDRIKRQLREESEDQLQKKQEEIEELRALLSRVGRDADPDTTATIVGLREELDAERIAKAEVAKKYDSARDLAADLQEELASARNEIERSRQVAWDAENEAREKVAHAESETAERAAEIDRLNHELAGGAGLKDTIASLEEQLAQAKAEAEENLETARGLHEKVEAAEAEASSEAEITESLRTRLQSVEADLAGHSETEEALRSELEQTKTDSAQRVAELDSARQEIADLRAQSEGVSASEQELRDELESVRTVLSAEQGKVQELQEQLQRAESEAGSHATTSSELRAQLETTHDELNAQLDELRREKSTAEAERDDVVQRAERLLERIGGIRAEYQAVEEDHQTRLAALETAIEAQAAQAVDPEEVARLQALAEQTTAELESLRRQADDLREQLQRAEEERGALEADKSATAQEVEELRAALEAANSVADREIEGLRGALDEMTHARESLTAKIEELGAERDRLQERVGTLEEDRDQFDMVRQELIRERESIQNRLEEAEELAEERRQELASERVGLVARIEDLEAALHAKDAEVDAARRDAEERVDRANARATELEAEIARMREASDTMRRASSDAGQRLEGAARSLADIATGLVAALQNVGPGAGEDSDQAMRSAHDAVSGALEKLRPLEGLKSYEEEEDHSI